MLGLDQLLLDVTPPELLGRAYALNSAGLMVTQGVGFATAGALGEFVPPDLAITFAGGTGLVVVALCRPPRRPAVRPVPVAPAPVHRAPDAPAAGAGDGT